MSTEADALRQTLRGVMDERAALRADLARGVPWSNIRRCQVIEADFEKNTVTFELPAGHSIGAWIDVAVYERDGKPSLTAPPDVLDAGKGGAK